MGNFLEMMTRPIEPWALPALGRSTSANHARRFRLAWREILERREDFWSAEFIPLHGCLTRGANLVDSLMRSEGLPLLRPMILNQQKGRPLLGGPRMSRVFARMVAMDNSGF